MKTRRRIIASLIVIAVLSSTLVFSVFNAFAQTQKLILNVKMTAVIDGEDDLAMFTYTPDEGGIYSFLSYNTYASEGYLFTREKRADGTKYYNQLAYSNDDENYESNEHNFRQFCLTYHLEKGVTYFFGAGFYLSENHSSGNMNVMLRCDSYDTSIESITASCSAELEAYQDGEMMPDSDGNLYFRYNISKIISNTTVTIYYYDGTSTTLTGAEVIDGYNISYRHKQNDVHWYPQGTDEYTANTFTVSVLDKSFDFDISIVFSARYTIYAKVVDTLGNPVANASVTTSTNDEVATTDSNGEFNLSSTAGYSRYKITCDNALEHSVMIMIAANNSSNDYRATPIELCTYDYCHDGIINAKDFAIMNKSLTQSELDEVKEDFRQHINFTTQDYALNELINKQ